MFPCNAFYLIFQFYFMICFFLGPLCGTSAASQVDAAVSNLVNNGANFNMFWIDVEDTDTNTYWGSNFSFLITIY